jgi:MFS family permease
MLFMNSPYGFLWGICSARLLFYLSVQNYPALIPVLQKEWGMSGAAAGSVVSAYQVGFLISLVGLSSLTDWVSTRKVFLYSCIASAIAAHLAKGDTLVTAVSRAKEYLAWLGSSV